MKHQFTDIRVAIEPDNRGTKVGIEATENALP